MDLNAFKMIRAAARAPCHPHYQRHKLEPDCLEARRPLWFWAWGVECGADDDTNHHHPPTPPPSTRGLIQLSCCGQILGTVAVSHGEEIIPHWSDQALAGTGRAVREEMYTRCWKGAKERQGETEILQKTDTFTQKKKKKNQQLVLSYFPPNPLFFSSSPLSLSLHSVLQGLRLFAAPLSCKLKLVSAELLILVSVY